MGRRYGNPARNILDHPDSFAPILINKLSMYRVQHHSSDLTLSLIGKGLHLEYLVFKTYANLLLLRHLALYI